MADIPLFFGGRGCGGGGGGVEGECAVGMADIPYIYFFLR